MARKKAPEFTARLSPDGWVAQHFDKDFNSQGHWVMVSCTEETGMWIQVLDNEAVADWPPLQVGGE